MTQPTGFEFERRVADVIGQLDFKVTTGPLQRPVHPTWQDRISSWLMKPSRFPTGPDMLVTRGTKTALVEVKAYPILLGSVIQARHYSDYFDAPAIICVPDDAFQKIPVSVREWAEANSIVLSSIGELGDNLNILFQESDTSPPIHHHRSGGE